MKETNQHTGTPVTPGQDRTYDSSETIGSILKRSRLSQRKTHEEIAKLTRIPVSTLKAIEEGEDGKLPAEVFLRGFLKIYARHLGLDPDMAVNCYAHHHGDEYGTQKEMKDKMPTTQEFYTNDSEPESASFPLLRALFFISLLVLLGLLAYWGYTALQVQPGDNAPASAFPPGPGSMLQEQHDGALPGSETAPGNLADQTPPGEAVGGTETDPGQAPTAAEIGAASAPVALPGAVNTAPVVPGLPTATLTETAAGKPSGADKAAETDLASETTALTPAPLTINPNKQKIDLNATEYALKADFLEPTWLKIDIDGNRTREYTFKPGDHLSWRAQKSLRLVVGNAGGVSLTLNGEKLPPMGPSGKSATLTLPKEVP